MKNIVIFVLLAVTLVLSADFAKADQTAIQPPSPGASAAIPTSSVSNSAPSQTPLRGNENPVRPATGSDPAKFLPAPDRVCWVIFGLMTSVLIFGVFISGRHLSADRDWNFGDLMSGADGKPSASRMIAFLGFLVMTTIILGIGYSSLWVFLKTGQLPSLSGASTFLLACAGLFTPYFANQVGLAIGSPSTTPSALAPVVVQSSSPNLQMSPTGVQSAIFGPPVRPGSV
jgi:hypothetical protein